MKKVLSVSVHDIVDSILRSGSIDTRVFNSETMQEGSKMHRRIQEASGSQYDSEVPLETLYDAGDICLDISGRADGIIHNPDGSLTVDEIKTTVQDLGEFKAENFSWHQGQAKMYAWMFLRSLVIKPSSIKVRVSYYRQHKTKEYQFYEEIFDFEGLEKFAVELLDTFLDRIRAQEAHLLSRNLSLQNLDFPYSSYRIGQRDLIAFGERICLEGKRGYALAPTGIGKTVCVLYPFLRALREGETERVYYLTSKNSIKRQALKTVSDFIKEGADLRCVAITAKETACLNEPGKKKHCNPVDCPFAVGYYSKLYDALRYALQLKKVFDTDDIEEIAVRYGICPFQFSLDLAVLCDVCVFDYNYVYDPIVGNPEIRETNLPQHGLLLVDEAHNLPSRAREMYSSHLYRDDFEYLFGKLDGRKHSKLKAAAWDIVSWFDSRNCEGENEILDNIPDDFMSLVKCFSDEGIAMERKPEATYPDEYVELKAKIRSFLLLPSTKTENYAFYVRYSQGKAKSINIHCLDASKFVRDITDRYDASLFFSATLSPEKYYISLLGGEEEDMTLHFLKLPSPFDPKNRLVMEYAGPSIKYSDREKSMPDVLNALYMMAKSKVGNYFFFFPSYEYMLKAYELFQGVDEFVCSKQEKNMSPSQRSEFLNQFEEYPLCTHIGFLVLGGMFSEGIELSPHALSGVAVVSIGLPSVGFENSLLRDYYSSTGKDGFDFAFTFPGFNKVVQASGRVIRSEDDKGVILLIDKRFARKNYEELLDDICPDRVKVSSVGDIKRLTEDFWNNRS